MFKFSVLLPTRNRLEYLKYAVASVMQQDYDNWEIIVSDNDSEENIQQYIQSLSDPRIHYYRTKTFIPVTENWNNAMEKSTGDYVIMLGDDDCILPNYFSTCNELIQAYQFPDMLYTRAFMYAYPKVFPNSPGGYLVEWGNASFFSGQTEPFILNKEDALKLVKKSMNFKVMVNFNMQFSLVSRTLIKQMQTYGSFYQSPYPDYYATIALLIEAKRILAVPHNMVVVGITPKSFGYYYFNNKESEGNDFLKNISEDSIYQRVKKYLIPGTNMNSSWLLALETVKKNFEKKIDLKVNYKRYRLIQALHHFKSFMYKEGVSNRDLLKLSRHFFWWEKPTYLMLYLFFLGLRIQPTSSLRNSFLSKMVALSHPSHGIKNISGEYQNILDVFKKFSITLTKEIA